MPTLNRIKAVLADRNTSAAQVARVLPDANTEVPMSFISQGKVLPTRDDLEAMCAELHCTPVELYPDLQSIDLAGVLREKKAFPKLDRNRDRSGRIWIDSGNEESKNNLYQMICDLGMDGWQGWYKAMLGVTEYMHADMMKMKEREHEGL